MTPKLIQSEAKRDIGKIFSNVHHWYQMLLKYKGFLPSTKTSIEGENGLYSVF